MRIAAFLLFVVALTSPLMVMAQREKLPPEDLAVVEKRWPEAKRTGTGIRSIILKEGSGKSPVPGDKVQVLYTGQLLNGEVFDKQLDPAKPFSFRIKRDQVIAGWDEALQFMKPGEKRLVIIPYELGYGTKGNPPSIPKRATLVFEIELLRIEN